MKTDTKFNSGPLSPAVAALLLAFVVAALCLIPVTGAAQILVANQGNSTIGLYDATTGAPINSSFISSGLSFPTDIALSGDKLYVANTGNNTIGLYNATTGATVDSSFISSGLRHPAWIALSGGKLFVTNGGNNTVGVYDATTGATIDSFHIPSASGGIGIGGIAVVGGNLFVVNGSETIGKYNATTGATIDSSFISSGSFLEDIAVSGGNLFVTITNTLDNRIGKYNATTGATIDDSFISFPAINSAPRGMAISGENLFVTLLGQSDDPLNTVGEYDATTGATINSAFISGLNVPEGIVVISPSSVPGASATLTLLLLGIGAIFGFNLLLPRQPFTPPKLKLKGL